MSRKRIIGLTSLTVLIISAVLLKLTYPEVQPVQSNPNPTTTISPTPQATKTATKNTKTYTQFFVPVTKFSSLIEDISFNDLRYVFTIDEDQRSKGNFNQSFHLESNSNDIKSIFKQETQSSQAKDVNELIQKITDGGVAIIPFDQLDPKLKVLKLNEKNILDKTYDGKDWPLVITETVDSTADQPNSNRDVNSLTTLMMTGVTAISRGVEDAISRHNDPVYPARGVMDVLSKADLTHVDNENPFFDTCNPAREGIVLCGKTPSIASLKAVGVDIVDLTGNHQNDYGNEKNLESIKHLEDAGFEYFGGGKNEQDAGKILYKEVNGTKLAFVGYNYFDSLNGPKYVSLALKDRPGANYYSDEKLQRDVAEARKNADIVIVDYQFIEDYRTEPLPGQVEVFRKTIDAGADIVVGVQAHQPQKIEFYKEKTIFYGLGNFFFDQMWSEPTRQGVIPRLNFYQGKLLSIELFTTLLYDYAQPQFTTGEERNNLLKAILPNN